jgi:hypothetical protein
LAVKREYGGNTLLTNGWKPKKIKNVSFGGDTGNSKIKPERKLNKRKNKKRKRNEKGI